MGRSIENSTTIIINSNASSGFSDGSATTPSIYFSNDRDCGLYRISNETIGFTTNGVKQAELSTGALTATNKMITPAFQLTTGAGTGKVLESDSVGNAQWVSATSTVIRTFYRNSFSIWNTSDINFVLSSVDLNITILNNEVMQVSGRIFIGNFPTGYEAWFRISNISLYGIILSTVQGVVSDRLRTNSTFPSFEYDFRLTSSEFEIVLENTSGSPITNQEYEFTAMGRVA